MQTLNKGIVVQVVTGLMLLILLILLMLMTGCAEWNSAPTVVDQNLGRAYHNMVENQTLYPEHGQNDHPILSLDGQKAQGVIDAYRMPAKDPREESKKGVTFDVKNVGGPAGGN